MEAGRTEEKRAVKKIKKIGSIDYERELEVLALLSYKKRVHPPFCDRLTTLIDSCCSSEITLLTSLAGMRQPNMSTLPWTTMNSAHSISTPV